MSTIETLENNGIRWINILHPDKTAIEYLKKEFNAHPLDCEDILGITHRSKINKYPEYFFVVLLLPMYNSKTKQMEAVEVDFFVGKDYLISIHHQDIAVHLDLFQLCQGSPEKANNIITTSPQLLLYEVIQRLLHYIYPMLDRIDLDMNELEKQILKNDGDAHLVHKLLVMRHNIIDMSKIIQPHRGTLQRLHKSAVDLEEHEMFELDKKYKVYFDDLSDCTQEIWDQLESFKESINALYDTNQSLVSSRINQTIKTLTIFSALMLPASVVAGIFGMNAKNVPFVGYVQDFFIMLTVVFAAMALTLLYIRKKRLL